MVRYFYAWTTLVIVTAVFILSMPWLGLIALMIVAIFAFVGLAALASAVVFVPYRLSRAIGRRWHTRRAAGALTAPVLAAAARQNNSLWQGTSAHPAALSIARELHAPQQSFPDGHVS